MIAEASDILPALRIFGARAPLSRDWNNFRKSERIMPMTSKYFQRTIVAGSAVLIFAGLAFAQNGSTRPRRVNAPPSNVSGTQDNTPAASGDSASNNSGSRTNRNATGANVNAPSSGRSGSATAGTSDTSHAYSLLQQKQYAAAAREAKQIAASEPNNTEAWKIAGFAEFNLKQYEEATTDLQRALDLQRAAKQEDANTIDALAQAYVLTEKFDKALPLLVTATTRKGAVAPDAVMLYYRGIAEYRTGKGADAERSFNAAVKANPKDAASLYYLGQLAYARSDFDAAVSALNRATQSDARLAQAWALLTSAYLRRAANATAGPKADADYLNAVRAGESLTRIKTDAEAATLYGQALIGAKQYAKAATVLERVTAGDQAKGPTLYLLGVAYSRAENFPKAIAALERAAALAPDDVNIYRQLGYAYEVSKLYAKALAAYQKGAQLAPADTNFKESIERVQPFAK
jgi:tetratricopeptide (TPR) repeat protein